MTDEGKIFRCPFSCDTKRPLDTLRKWKGHMERAHRGYTDEQLAQAANDGADVEGVDVAGRGNFDEYAASLPEDARELKSDYVAPETVEAERVATVERETERQRVKISKDMSKHISKIQEKLTGKGPRMLMASQGVHISDEENDFISALFEMAFDLLNISVEVDPINLTVRNPLYILALPFVACFVIFAYHKTQGGEQSET